MADASLAETAGPSTATDADVEAELKQAEARFQEGIQAIKVRRVTSYPAASWNAARISSRGLKTQVLGLNPCRPTISTGAVELFGQVLQTRCQQFGGAACCDELFRVIRQLYCLLHYQADYLSLACRCGHKMCKHILQIRCSLVLQGSG